MQPQYKYYLAMEDSDSNYQVDWELAYANEVWKSRAEARKVMHQVRANWVHKQREKARVERTINEIEKMKALENKRLASKQ